MFVMSVDFGKVEAKLGSDLFSEVISQIFDLRRVPDGGVGAGGDFLFFLDEILLFEEGRVDDRVGGLFGHAY